MKNEVFKKAVETVEAFQKDYQERLSAAEIQLHQLEEKRDQAEAKATEAVAADDQAAWRKADKDRTDAAAGIKFTHERLAMIQSGAAYPLRDYERLLHLIEAEQGRATLAFIEKLQELFHEAQVAREKLNGIITEGQEALAAVYAAGGDKEDGYRILQDYQPAWGYLLEKGRVFDGVLKIDTKTGAGLSGGEPIHRAVMHSIEAVRRVEGKA